MDNLFVKKIMGHIIFYDEYSFTWLWNYTSGVYFPFSTISTTHLIHIQKFKFSTNILTWLINIPPNFVTYFYIHLLHTQHDISYHNMNNFSWDKLKIVQSWSKKKRKQFKAKLWDHGTGFQFISQVHCQLTS
jgi:hypothetical protein